MSIGYLAYVYVLIMILMRLLSPCKSTISKIKRREVNNYALLHSFAFLNKTKLTYTNSKANLYLSPVKIDSIASFL